MLSIGKTVILDETDINLVTTPTIPEGSTKEDVCCEISGVCFNNTDPSNDFNCEELNMINNENNGDLLIK